MDWFWNIYERWPRATAQVLGTLLTATVIFAISFGCVWLFAPVQAAPATPDVECVEWAKAGPWTITRCEDWEAGETCLIANSGMIVCRFE